MMTPTHGLTDVSTATTSSLEFQAGFPFPLEGAN